MRDLAEYATPRQREILEAIEQHGTQRRAAEALGLNKRNVERAVERVKLVAARRGWSPDHDMVKPAAPGFAVRGTSTLYTNGEEGTKIAAQWVKTTQDAQAQAEAIKATVEAWCEEAKGIIKPVKPPKHTTDALLTAYPMGDPHFGMYAWAKEVGADFDLDIAERDLCAAVDYLVSQSPPSKRGVLVNLGDFFHYDSMESVTPNHGHILDADTRPQRMVQIGIRAIRRCIHRMLEKHEVVEVINAPGNHDPMLGGVMSTMLANIYENEPRIVVHDNPGWRFYVEHGKCLLGVTHGDKTKDGQLPGIMATEKPEAWGRTRHRYYWRGHHHHDVVEEFNGCKVEQFRTLAAGDAYAVGHGYLSGRDMKGIVMHKDYGEIARFTCGIDLLRAA